MPGYVIGGLAFLYIYFLLSVNALRLWDVSCVLSSDCQFALLQIQNKVLKYAQFSNIFMKHKLNQVNNHLVVSNGTPCEFYGNNVDCSGQ